MALTLDVLLEVLRKVFELPVAARNLLLEVLDGANLEEENPRMLRAIAPTLRELDDHIDGAAALANDIVAVAGDAGEADSEPEGEIDMAPRKSTDDSEEEGELQNLLEDDGDDLDDEEEDAKPQPKPKPKRERKPTKAKVAKPKKAAKDAKPKRGRKPAEGVITNRKLAAGTILTAVFKGSIYTSKVLVDKDGKQTYKAPDGRVFNSPSAAGGDITGIACNGWKFWSLAPKGTKLTSPKKVAASSKGGKAKSASKPKAKPKPKAGKKSKKSRQAKS